MNRFLSKETHFTRIACVVSLLLWSASSRTETSTQSLVAAARQQIGVTRYYDSRYQTLRYPNGDVPIERGVCTDVIIRAYRALGFDLQRAVHDDMTAHFTAYPSLWGLTAPDKNIDHRRVPNLATYFSRHGQALRAPHSTSAFVAGDVVTWRLPSGVPHIGLISDRHENGVPLVIHNIGRGTQEENVLNAYAITGHYRFTVP